MDPSKTTGVHFVTAVDKQCLGVPARVRVESDRRLKHTYHTKENRRIKVCFECDVSFTCSCRAQGLYHLLYRARVGPV